MNKTTGETKVGRRWNPVAKHDHNKGGAHRDTMCLECEIEAQDREEHERIESALVQRL